MGRPEVGAARWGRAERWGCAALIGECNAAPFGARKDLKKEEESGRVGGGSAGGGGRGSESSRRGCWGRPWGESFAQRALRARRCSPELRVPHSRRCPRLWVGPELLEGSLPTPPC